MHPFFSLVLLLLSMNVHSDELRNVPKLEVKPAQCVSLRQGQKCFVNVDLSWQVAKTGKYCLYSTLQDAELKCWTTLTKGHYQLDLVIENNVTFTLRSKDDGIVIASAELELAWVHKKSRLSHSSWRVF